MLKFLFKGLMRDRSRSLFPILTVFIGVALTVFLYAYLNGFISDMVKSTAHYNTGHVRIMTQAYSQESSQNPNDLALIGIDTLMQNIDKTYPDMIWTPRIIFGGLIDIPDKNGETRIQGPVTGTAINLFSKSSPERKYFNIKESIVRGSIPQRPGEILIAEDFAMRLKVAPGDTATLLSSTMYGSMAMTNFVIAGTVRFGIAAMDRGAILTDISDIQTGLDMQDAAGEILGFFPDDTFHEEKANEMVSSFNKKYTIKDDQFSPVMGALPEESGLKDYMSLVSVASFLIVGIFVLAMAIVLWNAGLMGSLRRYGEMGVRLAVGEPKGHIYKTLILESIMIGIIGSFFGTLFGLIPAYYMQAYGLDLSFLFENSSMMISGVLHAQVNAATYFIGFVPGILATVFGSAIAGIGIYKRETAQLFKELEV
ncbi:MAG: ABC transporter permease [Ignavibacteriaceae bacterium]|nr:ABC transporter permease [Ignavibacteriaceae bacterium]